MDLSDLRAQPVPTGLMAHRAPKVRRALAVLPVPTAPMVKTVSTASTEREDQLGLKVPPAQQAPKGRRVPMGMMVWTAYQEREVLQDPQVPRVPMGTMGLRVRKVLKVLKVQEVKQDRTESKVKRVHEDRQAPQVLQVHEALRDLRGQLVPPGRVQSFQPAVACSVLAAATAMQT